MAAGQARTRDETPDEGSYTALIAARIQEAHAELSTRWLVALDAILPVDVNEVFPSRDLLDHIPAILHEIGGYLRAPESEEIAANTSVIAKARELGVMRHQQKASVHQLLREYDILGRVLDQFVLDETEALGVTPEPAECIMLVARLNRAVQILGQTTIDTFVAAYTETIQRQTERLQSFNRTVTHELRNPLGTLQLALVLVRREASLATGDAQRWLEVMQRNVEHIARLLRDIERLTRAADAPDMPSEQEVEIAAIGREVARQLSEMAAARDVEVVVDPALPVVHVDAGRLELVLMNLVSNGIKYADGAKADRWVRIEHVGSDNGTVTIAVRDNGLGIGPENVQRIFERFYRAHADLDDRLGNDGSGLGLAIVEECVHALRGTIEVQSTPGTGTTFTLTVPDRPEPAPAPAPV